MVNLECSDEIREALLDSIGGPAAIKLLQERLNNLELGIKRLEEDRDEWRQQARRWSIVALKALKAVEEIKELEMGY